MYGQSIPSDKSRLQAQSVGVAVKSNHDVVRKTHHDDVAVRPLLTPCLDPQVEHVMEDADQFRAELTERMKKFHLTLSTLRRRPRERLRMTRGRCGSLLHIRVTFSFTTTSPV